MWKTTALAAILCGSLSAAALAQQTKPTSSGSNTGSPQAGNVKPAAAPGKSTRGQTTNARTTNATGSTQGGTHNGVKNPGSSAQPHVHAANAQKTDRPASGGDAGQGTPGAHSKRKTEAQKYTGTSGASGGTGGPKQ